MSDESPIKTTEARAKLLSAILDAAPSILSAARKINRVSVGGMLRKTETSDNLALFVPPPTKRGVATGNDDPYGLFPVTVSQTGGSAGDATTACSFTYTYTDPDGTEVTDDAPQWHRQDGRLGAYLAGEYGLLGQEDDGTYTLLTVDETPDIDDEDETKGWRKCCPARYDEDQAEPDRTPATGTAACDAVNLSKCRSKITIVVAGFADADYSHPVEEFNGTWELTYDAATVPGSYGTNAWTNQIDADHILKVYCSSASGRWFVSCIFNDGGWGSVNGGFDSPTRSCPPIKETTLDGGTGVATAEIILA